MKNKKKFLRTSISALVVVATVLISVVATIKYKEDYDEEKRFNYIRENVEKSSEEKILYNLKKKDKDIVGYIEIPNTTISYPVLQTTDEPDFYLNHDINRNYSFYGTPYLSAYCNLEKSDNLIIYGHNINGTKMFGELTKYRDENFFNKHRNVCFTTDRKQKYKIFSVISVNKKAFPYWKFVMAQDKLDYDEFINKVKKYSFYDVGITPQYGDKIITLSTCDNDRGNDYRFVVFGINNGCL